MRGGEEFAWHFIAHELGHPSVSHAKRAISATEFVRWPEFFKLREELDWGREKPEYMYFAQVAFWLYRIHNVLRKFLGEPAVDKGIKNFLIPFKSPDVVDEEDKRSEAGKSDVNAEATFRLRQVTSKAGWFRAAGVNKDGRVISRKPISKPRK